MQTGRFAWIFLIGFLPIGVLDGLRILPALPAGRGLSTLGLALLALLLSGILWLLRRPVARLLPGPLAASDALPLACGLACALVPQIAPLLPGRQLGGRLSYNAPWALGSTLVGWVVAVMLLGRLFRNLRLPARGLAPLSLGAWILLAGAFAWQDSRRAESIARARCEPAGAESAPREPDVALVVLDTMRAEGVDGSFEGQELMPFTRSLLAGARRYPNAYSSSNNTPPGHASLFTGLYPAECGTLPKGQAWLADEFLTIAEFLRSFGYRTAGVTSNLRLDGSVGFAQGFEFWNDSLVVDSSGRDAALRRLSLCSLARALGGKTLTFALKGLVERAASADQNAVTALDTTAQVGRTLEQLGPRDGTPVFLLVNYIDPHLPYATRADLAAVFLPNVTESEMERARHSVPAMLRLILEMGRQLERGVAPEQRAEFERRLAWLREAYWEQCRQTDEGLRGLFALLQQNGLLDPEDLVLITADHGEQLGEHGGFLHGSALFQQSVRVPFILLGGGFAPGEDASLVSGVDFFPTVLGALQVEDSAWPRHLAGHPLQAPVPADRLARFESGAMRGFIQGSRKMIATDHGDRLEWTHAFDLATDPEENVNLLSAAPDWVQAFLHAPPIRPEAAATLRRGAVAGAGFDLAALGYVDEVPTPQ